MLAGPPKGEEGLEALGVRRGAWVLAYRRLYRMCFSGGSVVDFEGETF